MCIHPAQVIGMVMFDSTIPMSVPLVLLMVFLSTTTTTGCIQLLPAGLIKADEDTLVLELILRYTIFT